MNNLIGSLPPTIWITLIILVVAILIVVVVRSRVDSDWDFRDVVKNPEFWRSAGGDRKKVDEAIQSAQYWSDDKVASLTRHYILQIKKGSDAWKEAQILRALDYRTHPTILELLGDRKLYDRLVKPTGVDVLPEAPFNRACDILGNSPPAESIGVLVPFLNDPSGEIRVDAAMAIAKIGTVECIPHVRKAFQDPDEFVPQHALMGLEEALNRKGLEDGVSEELFPHVKELLKDIELAGNAAKILYQLNPEQATEYFLSPELFRADSRVIHDVLGVLADARVSIERTRLLGLISKLEESDLSYPQDNALGKALILLGQARNPEDRELITSKLDAPEAPVAEGAAAGLLHSYDLHGYKERIWETQDKSGYDSLLTPQRYSSAVFMCDAEINNGGLAQYFVNNDGDYWKDAIAGLEAMGSIERLGVLKEAVSFFGPDGPSENRKRRQDQLSRLYQKNDTIFEELESRYYKSSEVLEVLVSRYVFSNPESFK